MALAQTSDGMSVLGRVVRLPLRMVRGEQPVRVLSGALRGLAWLPASATHGCWLGTYERRTQKLLSRIIGEGDVVFDVGANVGFYTLLAARAAGPRGRIVAFEPLPDNVRLLERHLSCNALANVEIVQAAVGETSGVGHFAADGGPSMGSLGSAGDLVDLVSLDDLLADGSIPAPNVVKIDVEGAESRVLEGGRRTFTAHRPKVVLAAHGWEQWTLCTRMLESFGYSVSLQRDGACDGNYSLFAS